MPLVTRSFSDKLARQLGADPGRTFAFLSKWQPYEGGTAAFNPLNTTQGYPGATNYNSVGVKNFPSEEAGVIATYQTLVNGRYDDVVQYLRTGQADTQKMASQIRTWGSVDFAKDLASGKVSLSMPVTIDPEDPAAGAVAITPGANGPLPRALPGLPGGDGAPRTYRDPETGAVFVRGEYDTGEEYWDFAGFSRDPSTTGETPEERQFYWANPSAAQQAQIDYNKAQLEETKANNRAQQLIEQGQLDLAREAQAEAKYWHDVQAQIQREQNAVTARGQDIDFQTRMADIQQAREASDKNFQVGMANATNDAQRNEITARWNQEQAAIAKMEDETRRILGSQQNQTAQFAAETGRATGMGQLALDTNRFLLEKASSPRDLFGLYFLQRGITPDWDTIGAGGTPAQGQPIVPVNPMSAYVPTTAPPVFNGVPQNQSAGAVGQATAAGVTASQQKNPFIGPAQVSPAPAVTPPAPFVPQGLPSRSPQAGPTAAPAPAAGPPPGQTTVYPPQQGVYPVPGRNVPINPEPGSGPRPPSTGPDLSAFSGVRNEDMNYLQRGQGNYTTTGRAGPSRASDYQGWRVTWNGRTYDSGAPGEDFEIPGGSTVWLQRLAGGGMVNDAALMAGDAPLTMPPDAGGARPEVILNPTRAPIGIIPSHALGYGVRRFALGTGFPISGLGGQMAAYSAASFLNQGARPYQPEQAPAAGSYEAPSASPMATPQAGGASPAPSWGSTGPAPAPPQMVTMPKQQVTPQAGPVPMAPPAPAAPPAPPPQQMVTMPAQPAQPAVGAQWDPIKQQYVNVGMGQTWVNSSANQHLAGSQVDLPNMLQRLAGYGVPLPPSLVANVTGQIAPTLNFSDAWRQRGMGMLPSLQTLNYQTPGEQQLFRGLAEGPGGVPWADLITWLGQGTAGLRKAQRARAA